MQNFFHSTRNHSYVPSFHTKNTIEDQKGLQQNFEECFYNVLYPQNIINCDSCKRQITRIPKILTCSLDYCIPCFSKLQTYPSSYHIIDNLTYPLFTKGWSAREEILLLEGLERFGYGNWRDIADMISGRTQEQIKQHYQLQYLSNSDCLPSWNTSGLLFEEFDKQDILVQNQYNGGKTYSMEEQNSNKSIKQNRSEIDSIKDSSTRVVGYFPKRKQFEVQYDNDAELLLTQMEFYDDQTSQDIEMKLKVIDIYNHRLQQRNKRKDFLIQRYLLDHHKLVQQDKIWSKDNKEVRNMMKTFTRYNNVEQHKALVQGIIKEKNIRRRIQDLRQCLNQEQRTLSDRYISSKRQSKDQKNIICDIRTRRSKQEIMKIKEQKKHYFSCDEQLLCNSFGIGQKQYILIRETIIREAEKQGNLHKENISRIFKIGKNIVYGIIDFLITRNQLPEQ